MSIIAVLSIAFIGFSSESGNRTKLWVKLKDYFLSNIVAVVTTPILIFVYTLFWTVVPHLFSLVWSKVSPAIWQRVVSLGLITILVQLVAIIYLTSRARNNLHLRVKFGIKWDKQATPFCPACETPLSDYAEYSYGGYKFHCMKCGNQIGIHDDAGERLSLIEAKKQVQQAW